MRSYINELAAATKSATINDIHWMPEALRRHTDELNWNIVILCTIVQKYIKPLWTEQCNTFARCIYFFFKRGDKWGASQSKQNHITHSISTLESDRRISFFDFFFFMSNSTICSHLHIYTRYTASKLIKKIIKCRSNTHTNNNLMNWMLFTICVNN